MITLKQCSKCKYVKAGEGSIPAWRCSKIKDDTERIEAESGDKCKFFQSESD